LVLCTAIVVIVVTSLLQGCGTEVLVNLLNIPTNVTVEDNENRKVTELLYAYDHLPSCVKTFFLVDFLLQNRWKEAPVSEFERKNIYPFVLHSGNKHVRRRSMPHKGQQHTQHTQQYQYQQYNPLSLGPYYPQREKQEPPPPLSPQPSSSSQSQESALELSSDLTTMSSQKLPQEENGLLVGIGSPSRQWPRNTEQTDTTNTGGTGGTGGASVCQSPLHRMLSFVNLKVSDLHYPSSSSILTRPLPQKTGKSPVSESSTDDFASSGGGEFCCLAFTVSFFVSLMCFKNVTCCICQDLKLVLYLTLPSVFQSFIKVVHFLI
jgi:hypothetical protein